jgi:glucosylceramidase
VNQTLYGGTLVNETAATPVYETYAQYFVRYVQAYAAQGMHISFITPQNEPFYNGGYAYPSMTLTTAQQVSLITAIGKDFAAELVDPSAPYNAVSNPYIAQYTKIEIIDHNWSDAVDSTGDYPSTNITGIIGSPVGTSPTSPNYVAPSSAAQYVNGVAFHGYGGNVSAQNVIESAYPNTQIFFTEQTGSVETTGTVQQNFANDLMYDMENLVVGGTRDWATTITKFNLALNASSGPKIETVTFNNGGGNDVTANSGDDNARGLVTINANGSVNYNEEYFAVGQIAKFVEPGAVRIGSDSSESVAFLNPDVLKTMVVVAYNNASSSESYQFNVGSQYFTYTIPTDSVVTFSWSSLNPSTGVNVCETTGDMTQLLAQQPIIYFVPEPAGGALLWAVSGLLLYRRPHQQRGRPIRH